MGFRDTVRLAMSFFDAAYIYGLALLVGLPTICVLVLALVIVHWDGHHITVCGWVLESFLINGGAREDSIRELFDELLSFGWIAFGLLLIYLGLLTPIANSFTINGSLWLKLLVSSGVRVQLARILAALAGVVTLVLLGIIWAVSLHLRHDLNLQGLLRIPLAIVGQAVFSSGALLLMLTILSSRDDAATNRNTFSFLALGFPFITYLIWRMIASEASTRGDVDGLHWIPWISPFASAQALSIPHSISCIVCGFGFYSASLLVMVIKTYFSRK